MRVSLVATTQPLVEGVKTAEDLLVYCARVSNPANQLNLDTGPKLLRYCLEKGHWSVFEQASMTVEIETSRAVAAQILRHRSFTFQEFSQRYSDASDLGFEACEARRQDEKNRQASHDDLPVDVTQWWDDEASAARARAAWLYREALARGIAKECARMVLPLSTRTRLYMCGTVRSWVTYLRTRTDPSTQKEHREVAEAVREIFRQAFPVVTEAVFNAGQK